ncbi:KH domain-containing protein, putative [Eimeria mitis]|uniref:KH domain-containing protein, putative n=1 Tax=Eimeria mitis TaxID=44415 RepID=U6KDT9_9EIME|nr:KH domain-containing protein, putative [Eimeria mitis]CDJ36200.1 KH domain-containing protein, putative [Eimeria mitis]
MARKRRTEAEAAAGGAAPATASKGGQPGDSASKPSDGASSSNPKGGSAHGQGRQNRQGGEAASRQSGVGAPSAAAAEAEVNTSFSSASTKSNSSAAKDVLKEPEAASGNQDSSPGSAVLLRREIDMTGMTASQKKNLKKKLRKQEQKLQAAELNDAMRVGAGAATLASRLNKMVEEWGGRLEGLEASIGQGGNMKQVIEAAEQLQKEMQETQDEEVGRAKKPINKRATVQQVQEKIKEAELTIQKQQKEQQRLNAQQGKQGAEERNAEVAALQSRLEESMRYLTHLKEQLVLTQQQSDLRTFQQQVSELKISLEHVIKQARKAAAQAATATDNRRVQQREGLLRRRLKEVGATVPEDGGASLTTVPVSLPPEASYILLTPQGQPSLLLRKVERKFGVLAEKKGAGERGVSLSIISYAQDACDKCVAFLNACNFPQIPLGLTTSPNCVSLEGQSIGAFIGSGGANLRRLEAELDVLLWVEDKWITVLGHEAAVKKAIPHIKESRSPPSASDSSVPQHKVEFDAEVVRAMAQGTSKTRAKVQEVESSLGVTVLVRPPRRGDTSKTAAVVVRGADQEACKKACTSLENAFKDFGSETVECDRMKATRILRGAPVDFNVQGHELISLLRCDEGVLLVGPSKSLPAAAEALRAAMDQFARATETMEIKATQLRILDRAKRGEIESLSGASCRPPIHDGEKVTLTFTGHPDAVQRAFELVRQTLEEQKEEEMELSLAAALLFLVDRSHRDLEDAHGLRIRVDVPRKALIVRGGTEGHDAILEAIKKVEDEVASSGKVATTMAVPREAVPMILGRQGANVRRLQSECNLDNIVIDGRPQAVYMLGSQAAVDQATAMLQEIVANSSAPRAQQNGVDGGDGRPRLGGRGVGRGDRNDAGGRGEDGGAPRRRGAASKPTAPPKPYNANVDDETAFPSLGACMARPGGRWQKKSPEPEPAAAPAEEPAKASSEAVPEVSEEIEEEEYVGVEATAN